MKKRVLAERGDVVQDVVENLQAAISIGQTLRVAMKV